MGRWRGWWEWASGREALVETGVRVDEGRRDCCIQEIDGPMVDA